MAEEKFMGGGVDSEKEPENTSNQQDPSKRLKQESTNTVPYYKLFSFADSWDYLLIFAGTIGAVGNGMSLPLGTIIFGTLVNSFGELSNIKEVVHEVSKVHQIFLYFLIELYSYNNHVVFKTIWESDFQSRISTIVFICHL